jgi:tetratricopeptide (TPR) repeat protein
MAGGDVEPERRASYAALKADNFRPSFPAEDEPALLSGMFGEILMRATLAVLLCLTAAPAFAQGTERYTEPTEAIVVTGVRIQDYRDRLAACLARNCPPNEDADATLALAEALMLDGDYGEARRAVNASLGRNRNEARDYPEPVSDLYRAHSRLSRHTGFDRVALRSANGILDALQEGIPQEDHRHFTARFELAEIQMATGEYQAAQRELSELVRVARRNGRGDVAIMAQLRKLLYEDIAAPDASARARLTEMASWTEPARRMEALGARALLARIYRSEGDHDRANALLAEIGRGTSARRRLIHSPRYQVLGRNPDSDAATRWTENLQGKWIDVGFWVLPNGHVAELEVLRSGGDTVWARPLLASIRGRLYSTGQEATYRLERYTLTARREQPTGTRLQQQMSDQARVEYLDLTVSNPPPAAAQEAREN